MKRLSLSILIFFFISFLGCLPPSTSIQTKEDLRERIEKESDLPGEREEESRPARPRDDDEQRQFIHEPYHLRKNLP